jgi:hypothetical protein
MSPRDIATLQRSIGNRALTALLTSSAEPASLSRRPVVIQRDVVSDVATDSQDFWIHLTTRTMVRYNAWIQDTRQALNQFVTDMGDKTEEQPPSALKEVVQSWIGTIEYAGIGDLVNAAVATMTSLVEMKGESGSQPLSLAKFSDIENTALQQLSIKANSIDSDLPIYVELRTRKESEAASTAGTSSRTDNRLKLRSELNRLLENLPNPMKLRQELVLRWMKGSIPTWDVTNMSVAVDYVSSYLLTESGNHIMYQEIGHGWPSLRGVSNSAGTITALKGAFGEGTPLNQLPINIALIVTARSVDEESAQRTTKPKFWTAQGWDRRGNTWAPAKTRFDPGLGEFRKTGSLKDSEKYASVDENLFIEWLKSGHKPTVGELRVGRAL